MPRTLYLAQTRRLRAVLPRPRDISTRADAVRQPRRSARTWLVREGVAGRGAALALDLAAAAPAYASAGVTRAGHRSSSSHMKAGTGRNRSEGTRAQPRRTRRGGGMRFGRGAQRARAYVLVVRISSTTSILLRLALAWIVMSGWRRCVR